MEQPAPAKKHRPADEDARHDQIHKWGKTLQTNFFENFDLFSIPVCMICKRTCVRWNEAARMYEPDVAIANGYFHTECLHPPYVVHAPVSHTINELITVILKEFVAKGVWCEACQERFFVPKVFSHNAHACKSIQCVVSLKSVKDAVACATCNNCPSCTESLARKAGDVNLKAAKLASEPNELYARFIALQRGAITTPSSDCDYTCCVCAEPVKNGTDMRLLQCGHDFCFRCLVRWSNGAAFQCPLCKRPYENGFINAAPGCIGHLAEQARLLTQKPSACGACGMDDIRLEDVKSHPLYCQSIAVHGERFTPSRVVDHAKNEKCSECTHEIMTQLVRHADAELAKFKEAPLFRLGEAVLTLPLTTQVLVVVPQAPGH